MVTGLRPMHLDCVTVWPSHMCPHNAMYPLTEMCPRPIIPLTQAPGFSGQSLTDSTDHDTMLCESYYNSNTDATLRLERACFQEMRELKQALPEKARLI